MSDKELIKKVEEAASRLGEEFEVVLVMVSWPEEGGDGSKSIFRGVGNWYARKGMAHEFIDLDKAQKQADEIGSVMEADKEGEGE